MKLNTFFNEAKYTSKWSNWSSILIYEKLNTYLGKGNYTFKLS